jgi:hypothetical protein
MMIGEVEIDREKVLVTDDVFVEWWSVRSALQELYEGVTTKEVCKEALKGWSSCEKECRWYGVLDGLALEEAMRILLVEARTELVFIQKERDTSMTLKGRQSQKAGADIEAEA